jgi:hypothetical protein
MVTIEQLHEVERQIGFRYPSSFREGVGELVALVEEAAFNAISPRARLLWTASDIEAARQDGLPGCLIPSLAVEYAKHTDYYCFYLERWKPEYQVVAFAVHTGVAGWPDFRAFLIWAKGKRGGERT